MVGCRKTIDIGPCVLTGRLQGGKMTHGAMYVTPPPGGEKKIGRGWRGWDLGGWAWGLTPPPPSATGGEADYPNNQSLKQINDQKKWPIAIVPPISPPPLGFSTKKVNS